MLSGVVAAQQAVTVPRGTLVPARAYTEDEVFLIPTVVGGGGQVASAGLHTDADGIFATRSARALVPSFKVDDGVIFAPRIRAAQVLRPALCVAVDVLSLPAVALPGILQTHLHPGDDAVLVPSIIAHGSLRPGLFNAFDAVYAPTVVAAQTLLPSRHTDADSTPALTVRVGIRPLFVSDTDVHYTSSIAGTVVLTTFDGVATEVALTGGNLTGTHTNASTSTAGARSTANKTTGKYYFEVTATATGGTGNCAGLIASSATYTDILNLSANCTVAEASGNVFSNDGFQFSFGSTITAGTIVGVAVDLGARLAWFRRNAGNWNNNASYNPATGVGGVPIESALSFAPVIVFNGHINDVMTANFGQSAFANPAPTGFGFWSV